MGEVIHLRPQPDEREAEAWETARRAILLAQSTGRLRDMGTAVRAYEAWLAIVIPDEADRRRVWP